MSSIGETRRWMKVKVGNFLFLGQVLVYIRRSLDLITFDRSLKMNKVLFISLIISVIFPLTSAVLTKLSCSDSGVGTCANPFCSLEPIEKRANFGCGQITRQLNKINIRQRVSFKLFGTFLPVDIFPDVELCNYVKQGDKDSFFSTMLRILDEQVPGLIHQCPYQGKDFQVRNFKIDEVEKILKKLWFITEYQLLYQFSDDRDKNIFTVMAQGDTRAKEILE